MSWQSILILTAFIVSIPAFMIVAWVKDRFDEMDGDRP